MTLLQAIVLGVVQGFTEFLPVSSSAHLVILQHFFGLKGPILLVFDVIVHLGTLLSLFVYFGTEFFSVRKINYKTLGLIILATIPTGVIALMLRKTIEGFFLTQLAYLSAALLVTSILLWSTRSIPIDIEKKNVSWLNAFLIGVVQGISAIPGISRSGSTVTAALWLKIKNEEAVRFSFLIAIPAILGANFVILPESIRFFSPDTWPVLLSGFIAAFISGYVAIGALVKIVLKGRFHYFAIYTLALAVISFVFSLNFVRM